MSSVLTGLGFMLDILTEDDPELAAAKKRAADKVKASAVKPDTAKKTSIQKRADTIKKNRKKVMSDAAGRNQQIRKDRRDRLKQADQARAVSSSAAKAADATTGVNAQLAHCILAVHRKRRKSVRGAWNICRATLTKYGYLKGPYDEKGKVSDLKPTQKGTRRAMQHAFEKRPLGGGIKGTPAAKYAKFRALFKQIEPAVT